MKHLAIGAAAMGLSLLAAPAAAQTRVGNDPATISRALVAFGYAPQFRLLDREIVRTEVEACRGRDMFRVSVNVLGAVKTKERRGSCDIPGAVAQPATKPQRVRAGLSTREVRRKLRSEGYDRIRFTDREPPRYRLVACNARGREVDLVVNRMGKVQRSTDTGRCTVGSLATAKSVRTTLQGLGYDRIRILSERAPFGAVGCRENRRERLVVDRRNEVISTERVGRCRPRLNTETLAATLTGQGLLRVNVTERDRGFAVTACEGLTKVQLVYNRAGERRERKVAGKCEARSAAEILSRLESRGAEKVGLVVEGCFRNDRFRWSFNRLGDRTARKRIGSC